MDTIYENGRPLKPYNISFHDGKNIIGVIDDKKGILVSVQENEIIRFYKVVDGALVLDSTEDLEGNNIGEQK